MSVLEKIRHSRWFDAIYKIGISIKGFDGAIELIAGLILVFSPQTSHYLLTRIADYFADKGTSFFDFIASAVVKLDTGLIGQTTLFVIIFLLSHGLIKVILVYCLLRKFYRIYPYALVVLILMLFIQLVPLVGEPDSIALWLITILNVSIIYLVWAEYLDLREKVNRVLRSSDKDIKKL